MEIKILTQITQLTQFQKLNNQSARKSALYHWYNRGNCCRENGKNSDIKRVKHCIDIALSKQEYIFKKFLKNMDLIEEFNVFSSAFYDGISKKIILPPLSKKMWEELDCLKRKLYIDCPDIIKGEVFDTYEKYLEHNKKNPIW